MNASKRRCSSGETLDRSAIVVGAGIAGLAAAEALRDAGLHATSVKQVELWAAEYAASASPGTTSSAERNFYRAVIDMFCR